jgi:hypothetical protein
MFHNELPEIIQGTYLEHNDLTGMNQECSMVYDFREVGDTLFYSVFDLEAACLRLL